MSLGLEPVGLEEPALHVQRTHLLLEVVHVEHEVVQTRVLREPHGGVFLWMRLRFANVSVTGVMGPVGSDAVMVGALGADVLCRAAATADVSMSLSSTMSICFDLVLHIVFSLLNIFETLLVMRSNHESFMIFKAGALFAILRRVHKSTSKWVHTKF